MKKNKLLFVYLLTISFLLTASVSTFAQDEIMTNDEVLTLAKAGLNESIIINKIRASKTDFDLSTDSLIKLKKEKVSDKIVNAMLEAKSGKSMTTTTTNVKSGVASGNPNDPSAPHSYGIYYYEMNNGEAKMTQMQPNVAAATRVGGMFTSAMTYGIGKTKIKAKIENKNAALQIDKANPVFYFYLDENSGGLNTSSGIPSTPNEFALVNFHIRGDSRELTIGKANAFGAKGGLSQEYVVDFEAENLGNGIYKVTPKETLKNGEYGFYLINSGGSNTGAAVGAKFFDFGVKLTP
ncbi:MAG: hypothetical protein ACR2J3_01670 [Aridibacter sp.]